MAFLESRDRSVLPVNRPNLCVGQVDLLKAHDGYRPPLEPNFAHSYGGCSSWGHFMLASNAVILVNTTGTVSVHYSGVVLMTIVT